MGQGGGKGAFATRLVVSNEQTLAHVSGRSLQCHERTHAPHKNRGSTTAAFLSLPIPGIICLVYRSSRNSRPTTSLGNGTWGGWITSLFPTDPYLHVCHKSARR